MDFQMLRIAVQVMTQALGCDESRIMGMVLREFPEVMPVVIAESKTYLEGLMDAALLDGNLTLANAANEIVKDLNNL